MKHLLAALVLSAGAAQAQTYDIVLGGNAAQPITAGQVEMLEGGSYTVLWNDDLFGDYFLSMRPFKCLEGPQKLWCRVEYPYENARNIASGDLTDLEYDLMFVWKRSNDYGIDLWNGVYYALGADGAGFAGRMQELDLNLLAAPPENGNLRPITEDVLTEAEPASHWLPELRLLPRP